MSCCKTYDPCLDNKINQIGSYASAARQSAQNSAASAAAADADAAAAAASAEAAAISAGIAGIYLGAFAVPPTTDNTGGPLQDGMLYYNTGSNTLFVWNGSNWSAIQDDEIYLGGFAVAPALNNQGLPLQLGNLYWNSVTNDLWAYDGAAWGVVDFTEFTPFLATGTTFARNLVTRSADVFNVKDFGAVGDGVADDTAAIQAAINQAQPLNTSCIVYIPATQYSYRTTAPLTLTRSIKIVGDGNLASTVGENTETPQNKKSSLYFDHLGIGINITGILAVGVVIDGIETRRNQPIPSTIVPTPWVPAAADFDIVAQLGAFDTTIKNCLFKNATKGIKGFSLNFGRLDIYECKMNVYDIGIEFDGCYDVCRVDNVQIWPFGNKNQNIRTYTRNNLKGILTKRNDNPKISNFFTFAAKYGIEFSGSGLGKTERAELVNCGFDFNGEAGIYFSPESAYNSSAQIANTYCHTGEFGLKCDSFYNNIQLSNFRVTKVRKNGINISGGSFNNFQIINLFIDEWDLDLANNPAILCPSGTSNRVFIDGEINAKLGGTAPVIQNIGGIDSFEWFNQTAAIVSDSGTITSATCSIFIRKQNKTLKFEIQIVITDAGTGAGGIRITMPYNAAFRNISNGRILNTEEALSAQMNSGSNIINCKKYNGTTAIATGNLINITGEYYTGL